MYSVFTPENKEREAEKCKEVRTVSSATNTNFLKVKNEKNQKTPIRNLFIENALNVEKL